jgi:MHS family proline/betaine transporter-like MFS transporter
MMPTFVSLASGSLQALPTILAIFTAAVSALYLIGAVIIPETRGNLRRA